jgi:hypothetical protein
MARMPLSGHDEEHNDCRQDHEVGVEKNEDAGMVEAPPPLQAAGGLCHAPCGNQQSENLPTCAVKIFDIGESRQAQTGGKCTHRENDGADQRLLAQAEDRRAEGHNFSL